MTINRSKTKEIVFRRPYRFVSSIDGVELVGHVKILGVILHKHLSFDLHVTELLKQCSQRVFFTCCVCYVIKGSPLIN